MLHIDNITKTFGTYRALDGASLHVRRGTVFGLLGPNGSGKTNFVELFQFLELGLSLLNALLIY